MSAGAARVQGTTDRSEAGHVAIRDGAIRLGQGTAAFDVVEAISLDIPGRQFVCILGPSGCGKSTLLGAVAGHLALSRGSVSLDGRAIAGPHSDRGIVFQQHTLFPWLSVTDNVAFGLKMRGGRPPGGAGSVPARCSRRSACPTSPGAIRPNCRAACSSVWRSPARSSTGPGSC